MRIAGIDPGSNGALVILEGDKLEVYTFPKVGGKLSYDDTVRMVVTVLKTADFAFIEEVHGIKGSASKATFAFGYTCGALRAAIIMSMIPYEMATPQTWQKQVWVNSDYVYKTNKTGRKQNETKATSLNCAKRLLPNENFLVGKGTIPHDGVVDAALIAIYGQRKLGTR